MTLLEAITHPTQDTARKIIKAGDKVLVTYTGRRIPFHAKRSKVDAADAKYLTVGLLKFHRSGKQVGEKKSQPIHYAWYALTPEVRAAMRAAR